MDWLFTWAATNKDSAPIFGVMIALISLAIAASAFIYNRRANRRRATLDFVMKQLMDESSQTEYAKFKALLKRDQNTDDCFKLETLADLNSKEYDDQKIILRQLNIYELMSLGIRRKLFDETFYKYWYHNQFKKDYEASLPFIKEVQKTKITIYCEMTELYNKWEKSGHPSSAPGMMKMMWWTIRKDYHKLGKAIESNKAR